MANFNPSYIGQRDDILKLLPGSAKKVLDVGCSIGVLGQQIKHKNSAEVVGIEVNVQMAKIAERKLDKVIIGNIQKIDLEDLLAPDYFDCIIFADLLEHLKDPWSVLKKCERFLNQNGVIISSIPNIRHYNTIINLFFKGYWPYRERGIHDKTHLRFFTLKNIKEMFQDAGLQIVKVERNYPFIEDEQHLYDRLAKYLGLFLVKDFITFQFLIVAEKKK